MFRPCLWILTILLSLASLSLPQLHAQQRTEVLKGEVLVRGNVESHGTEGNLLVAIDSLDKRFQKDGVIDQMWLFQPAKTLRQPVELRVDSAELTVINQERLILRSSGGEETLLTLFLGSETASSSGLTARKLAADPHRSIAGIGLVRFEEGFEYGFEMLTSLERFTIPWDLAPLFGLDPQMAGSPTTDVGNLRSIAGRALESCDQGSGSQTCSAVCQFGSCRAECTAPLEGCCLCAMGTFPVCSCVFP